MNYTKGEWKAYQRKSNNVSICVKSSDKEVVVVEVASLNTLLGYDAVVANASLIAVAPDMYETLKFAVTNLINLRDNPKGFTKDILNSIIADGEKVLAEAEGKT